MNRAFYFVVVGIVRGKQFRNNTPAEHIVSKEYLGTDLNDVNKKFIKMMVKKYTQPDDELTVEILNTYGPYGPAFFTEELKSPPNDGQTKE
jgi:hypothetical protein